MKIRDFEATFYEKGHTPRNDAVRVHAQFESPSYPIWVYIRRLRVDHPNGLVILELFPKGESYCNPPDGHDDQGKPVKGIFQGLLWKNILFRARNDPTITDYAIVVAINGRFVPATSVTFANECIFTAI